MIVLGRKEKSKVVDAILGLSGNSSEILVLPKNYFPKVPARVMRKRLKTIKLYRPLSMKETMEKRLVPYDMIKEAIEKIDTNRFYYKQKGYYAGISWSIKSRQKRAFYFVDLIEGWKHFLERGSEFETKKYDNIETLLEGEREEIVKELRKLGKRKAKNIENRIIEKGGIRYVKMPPTSEESEVAFYEIIFESLPEIFSNADFPKACSRWFELSARENPQDKDQFWFITYLRPKEEWFCKHKIAAYTKFFVDDNHGKPYLPFTPFPKPSSSLLDFYEKLENIRKEDGNKLDKIEKEIIICKALAERKVKLFLPEKNL